MRCLKCGYISFDFNQTCPKCNKDISDYLEMMNAPSFRPNPPSLLGALIGETDESDMGIDYSSSPAPIPEHEPRADFDESLELQEDMRLDNVQDANIALETDTEGFSRGELIEISEEEDVLDLDLPSEEEVISFESEEITSEEPTPIESTVDPEIEDAELSLDVEGLSFEAEETGPVEPSAEKQGEEMPVGLDDITLDEDQENLDLGQVKEEEAGSEIDSQELVQEGKLVTDEIELKLDDLKINETGELEIETATEGGGQADETMEAAEISIDADELDLSDDSLETDDISFDEVQADEERSLDENIGLDDLISDRPASVKKSLQEPTLDLDLENLDLDLDLDNSEET